MNEKYRARPTEGVSPPQYKKKYYMNIGLVKHGFRFAAF
jgi:hypothetical protein